MVRACVLKFVNDFESITIIYFLLLFFQEKLSEENKKTAIPNMPSLLEMLGYSYFFGCCLVGPVLPIRRYQDFVNGKFSDKLMEANPPR